MHKNLRRIILVLIIFMSCRFVADQLFFDSLSKTLNYESYSEDSSLIVFNDYENLLQFQSEYQEFPSDSIDILGDIGISYTEYSTGNFNGNDDQINVTLNNEQRNVIREYNYYVPLYTDDLKIEISFLPYNETAAETMTLLAGAYPTSDKEIVINDLIAKLLFPQLSIEEIIGKEITINSYDNSNQYTLTICGIISAENHQIIPQSNHDDLNIFNDEWWMPTTAYFLYPEFEDYPYQEEYLAYNTENYGFHLPKEYTCEDFEGYECLSPNGFTKEQQIKLAKTTAVVSLIVASLLIIIYCWVVSSTKVSKKEFNIFASIFASGLVIAIIFGISRIHIAGHIMPYSELLWIIYYIIWFILFSYVFKKIRKNKSN